MKTPKIAFVYDRVNKIGGAERVLLALHDIWPQAPLFTAVYDKEHARWADVFMVHTSFLQNYPLAKRNHELYPWLTPMAFESFSFDEYDIVISVTSAEAKAIITKPHTLHICYCLTPTRYLWSGYDTYSTPVSHTLRDTIITKGLRRVSDRLRKWDTIHAQRPDDYIAISHTVEGRIRKYYNRTVHSVIYPPVDTSLFIPSSTKRKNTQQYFLTVSRLVGYKHTDIIISAFNTLGLPLIVVGDGWEKQRLQRMAKPNITFIDHLTDKELVLYYQNCRAFIFAGEEDFGIVAAEAQACGKPVIAYDTGGVAEIVMDGKTGQLFPEQTAECLIAALNSFQHRWYDTLLCRKNAERFSKRRFCFEMKQTVSQIYNTYI